jgi:hypothetical protein
MKSKQCATFAATKWNGNYSCCKAASIIILLRFLNIHFSHVTAP